MKTLSVKPITSMLSSILTYVLGFHVIFACKPTRGAHMNVYLELSLQVVSHHTTKIKGAPFWWRCGINQIKFTSLYRLMADSIVTLCCRGLTYLPTRVDSEGPQRAKSQDCWPRKAGLSDAAVLGVDLPTTTGTRSSQAETLWLCGKYEWVSRELLLQGQINVVENILKL